MIDWPHHGRLRRAVYVLTVLAVVSIPIGVTAAADNATLKGFLAYETKPAEGWRAVFVASNHEEFVSNPADADGEYTLEVPVGMRYTLVAGFDTSGERHVIANPIPQWVRVHGVYTIPGVVDFRDQPEPEPAAKPVAEPAAKPAAKQPPKASKPGWSTKKKAIVGTVIRVGAAAIIVALADDDDDDPVPSPSTPSPSTP